MGSLFGFFSVFSLVMLAGTYARKAPQEHWKQVTNYQPMPDSIRGLVSSTKTEAPSKSQGKPDCHTTVVGVKNAKHLAEDFDTTPNVTIYYGDARAEEKNDFDTTPNVTIYHGDAKPGEKKDFVEDFDTTPNVTIYHGDAETN